MRGIVVGVAALWAVGHISIASPGAAEDCQPSTFSGAFDGEVTLCQNWDAEEQQVFWFLGQGSQIIPYEWFLALRQVSGGDKFVAPAHMDGFRYLPQQPTDLNPDGLPIGFTADRARNNRAYEKISDKWLGLTCAACHTGQVEFENGGTLHKILIDGAPTMADFEGFMVTLVEAMQATLDDPARFDAFADEVLRGGHSGTSSKRQLRRDLAFMTEVRREWNDRNSGYADPSDTSGPNKRYGFARLDAIGAIYNEIAATGLGNQSNREPADAPVSYPFIWDTPQHDFVQWNGSVENEGAGALGRNIGEVLGVFGALSINDRRILRTGHRTSVEVGHLGKLEKLIWKLWSPLWPEDMLPTIDRARAAQGRTVFETHCSSCHEDIDRTDPERRLIADLQSVEELGTDPAMATNFLTRMSVPRGRNARIEGRPARYLKLLSDGKKIGDPVANATLLGFAVSGTLTNLLLTEPISTIRALKAGQPPEVVESIERAVVERRQSGRSSIESAGDFIEKLDRTMSESQARAASTKACAIPQRCYKGRNLNGIWATAPYLHNGSVRTLRQLLLPEGQRQVTFRVGSRRFDPTDVGFVDEGGYLFDTRIPGNLNTGHTYGAEELAANPDDLEALLEYLKTL